MIARSKSLSGKWMKFADDLGVTLREVAARRAGLRTSWFQVDQQLCGIRLTISAHLIVVSVATTFVGIESLNRLANNPTGYICLRTDCEIDHNRTFLRRFGARGVAYSVQVQVVRTSRVVL